MEGTRYVCFSSSSPPAGAGSSGPFSFWQQQLSPSGDSTDSVYLDSPPRGDAAHNSSSSDAIATQQQQRQQQQQQQHTGGGSSWRQRGSCSGWLSPPPLQNWIQRWRGERPPQRPAHQSGYMTLVPLSDARLKPRRTKLIVSTLLLLALAAVAGVFVLVPRGVSVGTIDVHSTKMTFNSTTHTYRIILQADVPIFNPNYLKASVAGNVTVSFYDAEAGYSLVGPVLLRARANPHTLSVNLDASNLPRKYTQVVYNSCFTFPRKLIFFLLGTFETTYLGYVTSLPSIDTYFMLDCSGADERSSGPHS